jgi:hypothetical protein
MPEVDFIALLDSDIDSAMRQVVREYSEHDFDQPTWDDAQELIRSAVSTRSDFGVPILAWAATNSADCRAQIDVAVFRGWEESTIDNESLPWEEVIGEIRTRSADAGGAQVRMSLLARFAALSRSQRPGSTTADARSAAIATWTDLRAEFEPTYDTAMMTAFNSWPGRMARYFLADAITSHGSGESISDVTDVIETMLDGADDASLVMVWSAVSELRNYYIMDPNFASHTLGRMFLDATHIPSPVALAAWGGFLHARGAIPTVFVAEELAEALSNVRGWPEIRDDSEMREGYFSWVAACILRPEISEDLSVDLIDTFVVHEDFAGLDLALQSIGRMLDQSGPGEMYEGFVWNSALDQALSRRTKGVPRRLAGPEAASWNDLALHSGSSLENVLDHLEGSAAELSDRSLSDPLDKLKIGLPAPTATALMRNLTARIRCSDSIEDMILWDAQEIVSAIREVVDDEALRTLVDAVISRGYPQATSWLDRSSDLS